MATPHFHNLPSAFAKALAVVVLASVVAVESTAQETPQTLPAMAPPKKGEKAPDFKLKTLDGKEVELSALTEKGPVVLLVLRGYPGYQCPICSRQVAEFIAKADEFAKADTNLVMVYPGPAEQLELRAAEFLEESMLPENFHFVTDPDYTFTLSYGLRWDAPRETAYPSTFVLGKENEVKFVKISKTHGGRTKADEILKVLSE